MTTRETYQEAEKDIPLFAKVDVLVVGGGPAGSAAAASAAALGADVMLVERYGQLGGMSTGGLVLYIERMTDWNGKHVLATGFGKEMLNRLPKDAILEAPAETWGAKDPEVVQYWSERGNAHHGVVCWSPWIDPEMFKITHIDMMQERGVKLLLHAWAVAPVMEGDEVRGVIFESKSGRQAVLAKVIVDATGDGDIFAMAGAEYESDIEQGDMHSTINVAWRWGGVDMDRYYQFQHEHPEEFEAIMKRGVEQGVRDRPDRLPRNDTCLFMGPRLWGYSCIDVEDLTKVEIESRRLLLKLLDFYKNNVPGFENAWILETAPQMGTRHSRRLVGVKKVTRPEWLTGKVQEDEIGVTPAPNPRLPNVSIPLGCLIPKKIENVVAAGRSLSCDAASHVFLRLIPQAWALGQGAGVAAAVAVKAGVRVRDVDVKEVQRQLVKQGVYLQGQEVPAPLPEPPRRQ